MIQLKGRKVDNYGQVIFDEDGLCSVLMSGEAIIDLIVDANDTMMQFNALFKSWDYGNKIVSLYQEPDVIVDQFHSIQKSKWFLPQEYETLDIKQRLLSKCKTSLQIERVLYEYDLFQQRELIPVLQFLFYLVDYMTEHDIVWGVGRGSSVASYCLYLIGVHRIDSLKFDLDIKEFLK